MAQPITPARDYWVGYRFTPRLIAAADSGVWVVENHLPLLVRIDPRTGEVSGPGHVGHGDPAGRGAHDLLALAGALWIRWNDGVSRFEPRSGDERWVDLSAAGHGAVWTLTWTHVPGGSTIARLNADHGQVEAQLAVEGSPRQIMVDREAVYVRVWRRDSHDRVEESLLRVDPATAEPTAELRITPAGAGGAVLDGTFWSPDVDPYAQEDRHAPSTARCYDATSGELLASVELPGWITAMAPGQNAVWACLERRGEPGGAVIELTQEGAQKTVELSHLDVTAHVPSPSKR